MFRKKIQLPVKIILALCILALSISVFAFYEVTEYNESVLDIYAKQQDAYVELVLEQIKMQGNDLSEDDLNRILGSLEASSGEYWTLARNHRFLYVKDATESKTYKGYSEENYYSSESAREFIDSLSLYRISNAQIDMNGYRYVASGTVFMHGAEAYTLCLLTHEGVILYSSTFFHTRVTISIMIFTLVFLLLLLSLAFLEILARNKQKITKMQQKIQKQNITIENLQDELSIRISYNTNDTIFHTNMLFQFLTKLEERKVKPLAFLVLKTRQAIQEKEVISICNEIFGKKYLKFLLHSDTYLFLYLNTSAVMLKENQEKIDPAIIEIVDIYGIWDDTIPYIEQFKNFGKGVQND